jgi:phage terminase large subunit-like protein
VEAWRHSRRSDFAKLPKVTYELEVDGETRVHEFVDYPAIGIAYCQNVVSGREPAGAHIRKACQRTLDMLERAKNPREQFVFSPEHVIDFCHFFELMPHAEEGEWINTGNPYVVLEPWQIWLFTHVYGFRRRRTGERLTNRALCEVPRKSSKSSLAAVLCLYELVNGGTGAQVLIGAATEAQGDRVYLPAMTLAGGVKSKAGQSNPNTRVINERAEELRERYDLDVNKTRIACNANGGMILRMNSIGSHNDGWNPTLVLLEELHAQDRAIYEVLRSAFGAKPNALMFMITTAGRVANGLAWDVRTEALEVLEGAVKSDTFFVAVYTVDEKDEKALLHKAEKDQAAFEHLMMIANPMWGVSIDPLKIWDYWQEAVRKPNDRAEFLRTRLNLWGRSAAAIITPDDWERCKNPDLRLEDFKGSKAWLGVDLMNRNDMASVGAVVPYGNDKLAVFAEYYVPEFSPYFEHPRLGNLYRGWADTGYLLTTPGGLVDFDLILQRVIELRELLDVQLVLCDDMQANHMVNRLLAEGIPAAIFRKNETNCTAATDDLASRAPARQLLHNGHPILAWNVANVRAWRSTKGGILPKKVDENSDLKIDGFDAVMMGNAARLHVNEPKRDKPLVNVYAKRGILGTSFGATHGNDASSPRQPDR